MPQTRRSFTVERRLRERGETLPNAGHPPIRHAAGHAAGPVETAGAALGAGAAASPEVMEQLRALTQEISELRNHVDGAAIAPEWEGDEDSLRVVKIEIARMVREIGRAKNELAALKHPLSNEDAVEAANIQLETIVATTEQATNTIMEATDEIEDLIGRGKAMAIGDTEIQNLFDDMSAKVIAIIEACSFQDLTGQRITKVIGTLRFIEERVVAMIDIWGIQAFQDLAAAHPDGGDGVEDGEKLSGPALEGEGLSQDDIDALFG